MLTAYEQHSVVARWVVEGTVVAFVVGEVAAALRRRRHVRRVSVRSELVLRAMLVAAVLWLAAARVLAPGAAIEGGGLAIAAGVLCAWVGLLLRWWSMVTLGRLFTTVLAVADDQPVIASGPYRWLRHPSYSGLLLVVAGCGVMIGNWVGLLGSVVIVLAALVLRIRVEERALREILGESYLEFARHRARLVPFVW